MLNFRLVRRRAGLEWDRPSGFAIDGQFLAGLDIECTLVRKSTATPRQVLRWQLYGWWQDRLRRRQFYA